MFEGFTEFDLEVAETTIHGRRGGNGPPLLLLHGIPETHVMWHRLAPRLAEDFTVVATDLRGYGDSGKPASTADHAPYTKRALARDQVEVMAALGFDAFAICGHDRGARCAYRLALDAPRAVTRLAVLDIVPTGDAFGHADKDFALGFWQWSFLAAPRGLPERLLGCDPEALLAARAAGLELAAQGQRLLASDRGVEGLGRMGHAVVHRYHEQGGNEYRTCRSRHVRKSRDADRSRSTSLGLW